MKKIGRKLLVVLCPVSIISLVGLGFSTWAVATQATNSVDIVLNSGNVISNTGEDVQCIYDLTLSSFSCYQGYGFVNETSGTYQNNVTLTGSGTFKVSLAKPLISTLNDSSKRSFKLVLEFSSSTSLATNKMTSSTGDFILSGFNTVNTGTCTNSEKITREFPIILSAEEYTLNDISFTYSIKLTYGNTLTSFPNLSSTTFKMSASLGANE